ncbi:hypothetical protein [Sphingomonas arenae]|uniref:hypothetical protein n=1 Tax=Sphingomonas arenae TaxID=2812555 RepID=UPI00196812D6|nr:hypothetical protein [Sphingomonas arenae]
MKRLLFVAALSLAVPAWAASLGLVNRTGEAIAGTSIRPTDGKAGWQPLAGAQADGARVSIDVSTDAQCAFDIRARLSSGKELVYSGVNLCETSAVTLNRRADGTTWVDYD